MPSSSVVRLRREDFRRTKHDSAFSPWKILIGDSDWKEHSRGSEGAERYRTQNLPKWTCCPGVYELGIAKSHPLSSREPRLLDSSSVIPVYLGKADNLRKRLQSYGRNGAHLEEGSGLFTDIFSRSLPIVYRCAKVNSNIEAEKTEKQLLEKFDYAWNKGSNGARRHGDICRKLDQHEEAAVFSVIAKKVLAFFIDQKEVGIEIGAKTQPDCMDIARLFGLKRVQQQQQHDVCGVTVGRGSVCKAPPVEGRKRCAVHKGMRVKKKEVPLARAIV